MKKFAWFTLIGILALALVLSSCSSNSSAKTTPPVTTTTAPPAPTTQAPPPQTTLAPPPQTTLAPTSSPSPTAQIVPTGTLRVADSTFSYQSMDPIFYESFWGWSMYDSLLSWDANGNIVGDVATSYSLSPDGNTWTFHIRQGIKFWDGTPLTAQDVAFSVQRFSGTDSTNPWSPYLRNDYAGMEVPNDYTFIYKTKTPQPALVIPFAWTRILPEKYIEQHGTTYFRAHPMGSGPYMFDKFISNSEMEFTANTNYWGQIPAYEHVIEYLVPEESTRIDMLKRGEVDIAQDISATQEVQLQKEGFKLQAVGLPTLANINFQTTWLTQGPTKSIQVRQAMSYAINRQELANTLYAGLATPGGRWFMAPGGYGWENSWQADPYDPAKAKQLLAEAGYPGAFKNPVITVIAQTGTESDLVQALQGYWSAVGIQTQIKIVDAMTYGEVFFVRHDTPGPYTGDVVPWIYPSFFDSMYHAANEYTSTGVQDTANDPQADALYAKAMSDLNPAQQLQDWDAFLNYAYTMWVNVGIVYMPSYVVVGPNVGAFGNKSWMSLNDAYEYIQHPTTTPTPTN